MDEPIRNHTASRLRMRLAQLIGPPGVDVHDPGASACPGEHLVLQAAEMWELQPDPDGRVRLDVTGITRDAEDAGWIKRTTDHDGNPLWQVTALGAAQFGRRWAT